MFKECVSIWGEKPKPKVKVEVQQEFPFVEKIDGQYRDKCMKEISNDAYKQVLIILDEIKNTGSYDTAMVKDLVVSAKWVNPEEIA